jgi:two-component system NarL family sensor kinase
LTAERRRLIARLNLAVREERARISRDLHDTTLQTLAVAGLRLHMLKEELGVTSGREIERLEEAIDAATSSTHALISELRLPVFERDGLADALRLALREIASRASLSYEVADRLTEQPPVDVATVAYEIAREILADIELHAHASRVEIELEERDGGLLVSIADDGPNPERPQSGSYRWRHTGLDPIGHRLALMGGRLDVSGPPERGTSVELWIPIALNSEEERDES